MTRFSTSHTPCSRRLDPFQYQDRAQTIRSRYIRHLAERMWVGARRKFVTGISILLRRRASAGSA